MLARFFFLFWFLTNPLHGFVLLSGPKESKLDITPDRPVVTFHWNGKSPSIKNPEVVFPDAAGESDEQIMERAINFALKIWSDVPGSFAKLEVVRDDAATIDATDFVNTLSVERNRNATSAAFALPITDGDLIVDCDMTIADHKTELRFLVYTIIHEMGHCLGLGHAHTNYGAIMGYSRDTRGLTLGADDMAGVIYLYPNPEYDKPYRDTLSCGTVPGTPGNSTPWLFFLPILFCWLRPRVRRS